MSSKVWSLVWEHAQIGGDYLVLLLALADQCDDDGFIRGISFSALAEKARIHHRRVPRLLEFLSGMDYIEDLEKIGDYRICLEKIVADEVMP